MTSRVPASQAVSAPASQPGRIAAFRPGIQFDWKQREVLADVTVVLREGLIELFACSPEQREHEAVVRLEARPLDLYHALGLIGLVPGHPLRVVDETEKVEPAVGAGVEIDVRFERSGKTVQEPIESWVRVAQTKKSPPRMPWVFAGSVNTEDGFAADYEGTVIALVDFSSSLIALSEGHSSSNEELWLEPATERIPPTGTRCTLVFRAGPLRIAMDAAGRITIESQRVTRAELARRLTAALKDSPQLRVAFSVHPDCPKSEQESVQRLIYLLGVEDRNVVTSRPAASAEPVHDPEALAAWLRQMLATESTESLPSSLTGSTHHLVDDLRARGALLQTRTEHVAEYLTAVSRQIREFVGADAATDPEPPAADTGHQVLPPG